MKSKFTPKTPAIGVHQRTGAAQLRRSGLGVRRPRQTLCHGRRQGHDAQRHRCRARVCLYELTDMGSAPPSTCRTFGAPAVRRGAPQLGVSLVPSGRPRGCVAGPFDALEEPARKGSNRMCRCRTGHGQRCRVPYNLRQLRLIACCSPMLPPQSAWAPAPTSLAHRRRR